MFFVEVANPKADSLLHEAHIILESCCPPSAQYNCNSFGDSRYSLQSITYTPEEVASGDGAAVSAGEVAEFTPSRGTPDVEHPTNTKEKIASPDLKRREPKKLILSKGTKL